MRSSGIALVTAAAVAFATMGIFGKLAYAEGATVGTLLVVRFVLAAILLWALVARSGALRHVRALRRRDLGLALGLGAVGYSAQAGAYFVALRRLDASLLALLVYLFPAIVTVAAILLGRERASRRALAALVLASSGLVLVLAGAGAGTLDPLGVALGVTAALVYSVYILSADGISGRVEPLVLTTLVCTGAAVTLTAAGVADGDLRLGAVSPAGLAWLAGIAVISTVVAIVLFFAGLRRVGPTTTAIVSTAEPLTAVFLAFLVFGESLGPVQLAGAALVLGAVVVLAGRYERLATCAARAGSNSARTPATERALASEPMS